MSTSKLHSQLADLAQSFTEGVLAALRRASLDDLLTESGRSARGGGGQPDPLATRGRKGRLPRRTAEDIAKTLDRVVAAVKATRGKGLRAEDIRTMLKLDRRELPRVLHEGLAKKKLKAKGQKRATRYFAR